MVTPRVVPVAPFTIINLFAGASHIRFRDFLVGTVVGIVPGVAAMSIFAEGILGLVRQAEAGDFLVVTLGLLFLVGLSMLARRQFASVDERTHGE